MTPTEALQLIAVPMRPDGTWNRDREACRQIAADALASMTSDPTAALKLARDALAAILGSTVRPTTPSDGAALNAGRAALAAIDALPAPSGEPAEYLFLQTDDDGRAWHRWCANHAEVREAVKAAMFFVADGEDLSAEHTDQLDASVEVLIDDGHLSFEGDPPLYLFRMGGAAWEKAPTTAQAAPAPQAASPAPAVPAWVGAGPDGAVVCRSCGNPPMQQRATPQEAPAPQPAMGAEVECDALSAWHAHWRSMYETQGPDTVPTMFLRGFAAGYRACERAHGITEPTAPTGGEG